MDKFLREYEKVIAQSLVVYYKDREDMARELYNEIYSKEFNKYLKYGHRPRINEIRKVCEAMRLMKQEEIEDNLWYKRLDLGMQSKPIRYIWRTMGDDKVRGSHADRDGQTFDWNSGDSRPGEDYNCRCYAEFLEEDEKGNIWYGKETPYLKDGEYKPHLIFGLSPESLKKIDDWYHEKYKENKKSGKPMIPYYKGLPDDTLHNNISEAESHRDDISKKIWFAIKVYATGEWDYKKNNYAYEDFGNFNYGATGRAAGISRVLLRLMAGAIHTVTNFSFGDDPRDQEMIIQGMDYYDKYYEPKYGKN